MRKEPYTMTPENVDEQNLAFAVLYTCEPDGRWRARVVDLPDCEASGVDVGSAKQAARDVAKRAIEGYPKRGQPIPPPVTICGYVRPRYEYAGLERIGARAAATQAVKDYRRLGDALPPPSSVCGYVWPEREENEEEKEDG